MKQPTGRIAVVLLLLLAAVLLATLARGGTAARVSAGSPASVRVQPLASRIDWSDGPFTIRIELSDLDHHGQVGYDDNRDTVPDRFEPSDGLAAFEILLHFSPAVVRVTHAEAGDFVGSAGRSAQCFQRTPRSGQFALGCTSTGSAPGPQGSGTLATITLFPVANGTSFLGLEAQLSGPMGDPIPVAVDGGIIKVFGAPEDAPTPTPEVPTDGGGSSPPTVLDGGELGDVTLPEGDPGPGATTGTGGSVGADGSAGTGGERSAGAAYPVAGTGYQPPSTRVRPLVLGGALAVAGTVLLLLGSRLAARTRRP